MDLHFEGKSYRPTEMKLRVIRRERGKKEKITVVCKELNEGQM